MSSGNIVPVPSFGNRPWLSAGLFLFLTFLTTNYAQNFVDPNPKIVSVHDPTHQFLDSFGRTRWFHGTNVVKKAFPWYPVNGGPDECSRSMGYSLCDSDMDYLQELGVNVIRLGVMWAGAEPTRGQYNETYFEVIHGIIQRLATRGIYTQVDVHQDVLARQTCGEGFPDWFVQKDWVTPAWKRFPFPQQLIPFKTNDIGIPEPWEQCNTITDWFISYLTVAVGNAFGRFYNNDNGLLDSFSDYWRELAVQYGNYSSVMGYDLLNEPWAGDIYKDPTLLVPGVADEKVLGHVWNNCSEKIRQVDNETLVFFEGVTWDVNDKHRDVPGGDGSKTAMSYHYYAPPQLGLNALFKNRLKDQDRLKTGGMLTEFRMWSGGDAVNKEMRETVELADAYLQSWMGWEFSSFWDQNNVEIEMHYARTYAPAVAGFVSAMAFNEDNSDYSITWKIDTTITAPTEIKINKRIYYPDGFVLKATPENAVTWEALDIQNIHVKYTANAVSGQNLTLEITKVGRETEAPPTTESPVTVTRPTMTIVTATDSSGEPLPSTEAQTDASPALQVNLFSFLSLSLASVLVTIYCFDF